MDPIQIGDLINSVIATTAAEPEDKTIMSITGTEHLENIWSNIYAYYLDEREAHGFGNLFMKTLERIIRRKVGKSVSLSSGIIKREYATIKGNRIDILIEAPNLSVIIENKVHHRLDNDLMDYWISVPFDNKIGIVLTLTPIKIQNPFYFNVTHREWILEIEKEISHLNESVNTTAIMTLKDFISTVKKVSKILDTNSVNYYLEHRCQINRLYSVANVYRDWLQSVFTDKAFIRSLGNFTLVHNDWIGCKHRFAMYRILDGKNGELVITAFYERLWNSVPGDAHLCLYLQPLGDWFEKAIVNKEAICSIAQVNGVPSQEIHKEFWHCASVEILIPEDVLQNEEALKEYLIQNLGNPESDLMNAAMKVGELLSETHIPTYQWKDAIEKLRESVLDVEEVNSKFIISQIYFKCYEPTTQIVVLEVTDNIIRDNLERYLDMDLLRAIRYAYGNDAKYTILCRQLML